MKNSLKNFKNKEEKITQAIEKATYNFLCNHTLEELQGMDWFIGRADEASSEEF